MSEGCGSTMKGHVGKVCKWACEWKAWFHARGRKANVCAVRVKYGRSCKWERQ